MKKETDYGFESYMEKARQTSISFYSKEEMLNGDPNDFNKPFPDWILDVADHFGQKVKTWATGEIFTLIGICSTFEDYYYILKDKDGHIEHDTCVDGIDYII